MNEVLGTKFKIIRGYKGTKEITIRLHPKLKVVLDALPDDGRQTFLVTSFGRPYTANGFGNAMRAWCDEAGLPLDNPNARWVLFGWGGRSFYVATPELTNIQFGPVLKSFGLDDSAMHVAVAGAVEEPQPYLQAFTISNDGLARLLAFTRASFAERDGMPVRIDGAGYGPNDAFYEGVGYFNAFLGCNTWTAAALREAGLRTGWWNPLPVTLGWSLALYN